MIQVNTLWNLLIARGTRSQQKKLKYSELKRAYISSKCLLKDESGFTGIKSLLLIILWLFLSAGYTLSPAQDFLHSETGKFPQLTSSNLPIVVIDTDGRDIIDEYRIVADMGIVDNGVGQRNYITDTFNNYNGKIAIELRGSATLYYPKKQYRLETQDSIGENLNVSLMGLPPENDWILYGPYDDQSLIRNVLAYRLSNDLGRYASRTRFCELILNGDYRGLYVLLEKTKRDKYRVDIAQMEITDRSGDAVTGGYIIKVDKISGENVGYWYSTFGTQYQYHYPKPDEIIWEQESYIKDFMDEFEIVMDGDDYADPVNGYQKYIDLDSFIDHFILNEVSKNVDAYRISAFLHKDRDSRYGKLMAGPIWDFNLSFGKAWFTEDLFLTEGWQVFYNIHRPSDSFKVPFWWEKLSRDSLFVSQLFIRWSDLRTGILKKENINNLIDNFADTLSEAIIRNSERWPESTAHHTYEEEILQMKEWISIRIDWMDWKMPTLMNANPGYIQKVYNKQNYPNPFIRSTTFEFGIPRDSRVRLEIFDMSGKIVDVPLDTFLEAGIHSIVFNASDLPSGIYFYKMKTVYFEDVKKMIIIK